MSKTWAWQGPSNHLDSYIYKPKIELVEDKMYWLGEKGTSYRIQLANLGVTVGVQWKQIYCVLKGQMFQIPN